MTHYIANEKEFKKVTNYYKRQGYKMINKVYDNREYANVYTLAKIDGTVTIIF